MTNIITKERFNIKGVETDIIIPNVGLFWIRCI